jgi:hypothetical protein
MYILPLAFAGPGVYERYEEQLIAISGPSFQKALGRERLKARKSGRRPYARFRQPPCGTEELTHNYQHAILAKQYSFPRWRLWMPWKEWCMQRGKTQKELCNSMYNGGKPDMDDLAVWAGTSGAMLDWKKMWQGGYGRQTAFRLWKWAGFLPPANKKRAREKVERFLRGSDWCRITYIAIPTVHAKVVCQIRRAVRQALACLPKYIPDMEKVFCIQSPFSVQANTAELRDRHNV